MIDALIKHVSVTYKCYEMYVHRGEKAPFSPNARTFHNIYNTRILLVF
jgi:hypothetical protein